MMELHHHKMAPLNCPACGAVNDGAMSTDEDCAPPCPGSAFICLYCAQAAILTDDFVLRLPSVEEMLDLLSFPDFLHALIVAKAYRARHPKAEGSVH